MTSPGRFVVFGCALSALVACAGSNGDDAGSATTVAVIESSDAPIGVVTTESAMQPAETTAGEDASATQAVSNMSQLALLVKDKSTESGDVWSYLYDCPLFSAETFLEAAGNVPAVSTLGFSVGGPATLLREGRIHQTPASRVMNISCVAEDDTLQHSFYVYVYLSDNSVDPSEVPRWIGTHLGDPEDPDVAEGVLESVTDEGDVVSWCFKADGSDDSTCAAVTRGEGLVVLVEHFVEGGTPTEAGLADFARVLAPQITKSLAGLTSEDMTNLVTDPES